MKYSPSVRLINIIIFALLLAGFGFLGVWFGFVISPNLILGTSPSASIDLPEISVGLSVMLGAFGLAAALMALAGFVYSVASFVRQSNSDLVVRSFTCYIGIGYIVAAFLFLNAMWLYRLTSSNIGDDDIAFVIVVYVILLIIALIGSNVPLMHLFGEGENTNKIMRILTSSLFMADLATGAIFGVMFLVNRFSKQIFAYSSAVLLKTGVLALMPLVGALFSGIAYLGYRNSEKHNTIKKRNGYLFETALFVNGGSIIGAGVFGQWQFDNVSDHISFMGKTYGAKFGSMLEFATMSYITGGLLCLIALILVYYTVFPPKLKEAEGMKA